MTDFQKEQALALEGCAFQPGSWDKRFAKDMAARARGGLLVVSGLTERQAAALDRLAHRYRKQLGRCMASQPCSACAANLQQEEHPTRGPRAKRAVDGER